MSSMIDVDVENRKLFVRDTLLPWFRRLSRQILAAQREDSQYGISVRRTRQALGLSLRELAHRSGMSSVRLGEIERGLRQPSATDRNAIAREFDLPKETIEQVPPAVSDDDDFRGTADDTLNNPTKALTEIKTLTDWGENFELCGRTNTEARCNAIARQALRFPEENLELEDKPDLPDPDVDV